MNFLRQKYTAENWVRKIDVLTGMTKKLSVFDQNARKKKGKKVLHLPVLYFQLFFRLCKIV